MKLRQVLVVALAFGLLSSQAKAHWCDNLWASSYNIVIRPESDTATILAPFAARKRAACTPTAPKP